jgi:antibiotic biosynthesis monooxygenase (ABM) superfamily enzyme
MMSKPAAKPGWIEASMLVGAGFFIFALILSAVFDPSIRVLPALQALIYVAVIILTGSSRECSA